MRPRKRLLAHLGLKITGPLGANGIAQTGVCYRLRDMTCDGVAPEVKRWVMNRKDQKTSTIGPTSADML